MLQKSILRHSHKMSAVETFVRFFAIYQKKKRADETSLNNRFKKDTSTTVLTASSSCDPYFPSNGRRHTGGNTNQKPPWALSVIDPLTRIHRGIIWENKYQSNGRRKTGSNRPTTINRSILVEICRLERGLQL